VQIAGDAGAFGFLAGNQPSRQVAIALDRALRLRHVPDDAQHAVVFGVDDPRLEVAGLVHLERVLDLDRLVRGAHPLDRVHHQVGDARRHDVADGTEQEPLGRQVEQLGPAGVPIHVGAVAPQHEHQVRNRAEDSAVPRLQLSRFLLGTPPLNPQHEEADDQRELGDEDEQAADHIAVLEKQRLHQRFCRRAGAPPMPGAAGPAEEAPALISRGDPARSPGKACVSAGRSPECPPEYRR
jgi:hypothetical protein